MDVNISKVFSSEAGKRFYDRICLDLREYSIEDRIKKGVLVGFSGGADSVLLLCFLLEYRRQNDFFPISVCHVHHGIRGEEADFDLEFSRKFALSQDLPFYSFEINVPAIAKEKKLGLEEAARIERYSAFNSLIDSGIGYCIAVAHNSTDNLETVIFNMMRGAGMRGMCGIPRVRDNIVRPILSIAKSDIIDLLNDANVPFCIDTTNESQDYTRNYIRHTLIPDLCRLNRSPEDAVSKMIANLSEDRDYLDTVASDFIRDHSTQLKNEDLLSLHPAIFSRVFIRLAEEKTGVCPEKVHVLKARELLLSDSFSLNLPGKTVFFSDRGVCGFRDSDSDSHTAGVKIPLKVGKNSPEGYNVDVYVGDCDKIYPNVYKYEISAFVSSDIINKGLHLRFKEDGDAYRFGGMNHKLKKVFNDKKIPLSRRGNIPFICDTDGIVWVVGLPVRDAEKECEQKIKITVCFKETGNINLYSLTKCNF
jgi:tRNA(Ile)-lysidine synthase